MSNVAYLVTGHTGEYSDYTIWNFGVYTNENIAEDVVCKLNRTLKELDLYGDGYNDYSNWDDKTVKIMEEIDENFRNDYTGTYYRCDEVKLNDIPKILLKD